MDKLILDIEKPKKKKKEKKSLLEEFDEMEEYSARSTIADYKPKKEKKKTSAEEIEEANEMGDDWLRTISTFKQEPIKLSKSKSSESIFDYMGNGKKKKKKKKKESDIKDYSVEFEPEMTLIKNLLEDQTQFIQSLQRRYDVMDSAKSSARGVGKFTTDLIASINQARGVSIQLVNNMASLKKTIADLNMKERKEKMAQQGGDDSDIGNFSAAFLKKMIQQDRADAYLYGDDSPAEGDADDIFDNLTTQLADSDRPEEVDKYLKYENQNVEVVALVNPDNLNDYELQAIDDEGNIIDDYPLPEISSLEVNPSTGLAADELHTKYKVIYK